MRNPFRSEADAFRFVWLTIGYFVLIFVGSLINLWFGIAVFIVVTAVAFRWFFRRDTREAPVKQTTGREPAREYRILVVANETVGGPELLSEIRERSAAVTPACSSSAGAQLTAPALGHPTRTTLVQPRRRASTRASRRCWLPA